MKIIVAILLLTCASIVLASKEEKMAEKILSDMGLAKKPDYKHVSLLKSIQNSKKTEFEFSS